MRFAMTALAVVLLVQAAPALAQDRGGRADRAERAERMEQRRDRPHRDGERARPQWRGDGGRREAPRAAQAPQAAEAPRAAEAQRGDRPRFRGDGASTRNHADDRRGDGRRDGRRDGDRDWDRRDGRRGDGDDRRDRGDRRDWDGRRDHDRRDWDRRDRDRRDWDRRDDRRDHRRWERGRYPSVYFSPYRYRHHWRAPSGFYARIWSYGDHLPRGWWGPGWSLVDPWSFDLPLPPPGYQWVRAGDDALLIDEFNGRIVQVVRNVFW